MKERGNLIGRNKSPTSDLNGAERTLIYKFIYLRSTDPDRLANLVYTVGELFSHLDCS